MKLSEIALLIGGQLEGADKEVKGVAELSEAGPDEFSFLTNPKYLELALKTRAAAVILKEKSTRITASQIICANPYLAFAKALTHFNPRKTAEKGVHPTAVVEVDVEMANGVSVGANVYLGTGCKLGRNVELMPNVVIGAGAVIGDDTLIFPNVTISEKVIIGKRVIIHSGSVIGSDGFGYAPDENKYFKIPRIGTVLIEDDVEIGANVTIDRATLGKTIVRQGAKIDNLVMVAHNVEIGEDTILISQVGIAGSTRVGKHCTLAGQVGVTGHVTIGDNVVAAAQSGVTKDIAPNQMVSGLPAVPIMKERRKTASLAMLPDTMKKIRRMEKRLAKLESQLAVNEKEDQ